MGEATSPIDSDFACDEGHHLGTPGVAYKWCADNGIRHDRVEDAQRRWRNCGFLEIDAKGGRPAR